MVYAYEVGSQFDFQLNYEMSVPQGIDPARLGQTSSQSLSAASVPASAAIDDAEVIAVPSSAAPALAARPPVGYSYVGCFNEIPGRAFTSANKTGSTMTAHECSSFCSSEQYFGTEFGTECYCGDKINIGSTQVSDGCDTPCMGDKTQVCGGVQHLTVYRKETQTA